MQEYITTEIKNSCILDDLLLPRNSFLTSVLGVRNIENDSQNFLLQEVALPI